MVVDETGKLWVMDSVHAALDAFPEAANGSVNPTQTITGKKTLLLGLSNGDAQHPAVDALGNVWVPQWYGQFGYVVAYNNRANGNAAPVATVGYGDKGMAEGFSSPSAIAFDSAGNLYVLNGTDTLLVFTPPFSDTEQPTAIWQTGQFVQYFMASDGTNVYTASFDDLVEFKGGLNSDGQYTTLSLLGWKHGGGDAFDLKTDSHGRVYFPMVHSPRKDQKGTIAILPPSPDSIAGSQLLFNTFDGGTVGAIAISP